MAFTLQSQHTVNARVTPVLEDFCTTKVMERSATTSLKILWCVKVVINCDKTASVCYHVVTTCGQVGSYVQSVCDDIVINREKWQTYCCPHTEIYSEWSHSDSSHVLRQKSKHSAINILMLLLQEVMDLTAPFVETCVQQVWVPYWKETHCR